MIVENYFPYDPRVRKEAAALKNDYNIFIIALKEKGQKYHEIIDGTTIFRIPDFKSRMQKHMHLPKTAYIIHYALFTLLSLFLFITTHVKNKYKVIHVHNPPDTLFIIGLVGKMLGIKYIYDHHDLSPELYRSRFSGNDWLVTWLLMLEKINCKLADKIIETNYSYGRIDIERNNIGQDKIAIIRNDPIVDEFAGFSLVQKKKDKINITFVGSINPQDGLDQLILILDILVHKLNEQDFICNIVGDGDSLEGIERMVSSLRLNQFVNFTGRIADRQIIARHILDADICLEPAPDNALNRVSTFIKIMEYMAAGKPIVAFNLPESAYSAEGAALFIPPGDLEGFARAIQELIRKKDLRDNLGLMGKKRVLNELNWGRAASLLLTLYTTLLDNPFISA